MIIKPMSIKRYVLLAIINIFLFNVGFADIPREEAFDHEINTLYQNLNPNLPLTLKFGEISRTFLGRPYVLGPLGEGQTGRYDQDPLYRTDQYDCLTYVDTVLALTYAKNLSEFKEIINRVRYREDKPTFTDRNHFMSADWNKFNAQKGYVKDITLTIKNKKKEPVALYANTLIDKPNWYKHFTKATLKLNDASQSDALLLQLQHESKKMTKEAVSTPYIPLQALFDKNGKPNQFLFSQIPTDTVIEIVRPNWELKDKIGTNLNISHVGFGIREEGTLMFRHASTTEKKVVSIPLVTYLKQYLSSPTIKGINIQQIIFE